MENKPHANPATPEEIWAILRSVSEKQEKSAEEAEKTAERSRPAHEKAGGVVHQPVGGADGKPGGGGPGSPVAGARHRSGVYASPGERSPQWRSL